jgi:hypothetical protein
LWLEDECCRRDPSAERIEGAWLRLFGEEMPSGKPLEEYDGGDTFAYLWPGGRVSWSTYGGAAISLAPGIAPPQTRPNASRGPTDDEVFSAICADFPFDSARLAALRGRLEMLLRKDGYGDGTIDRVSWQRIRNLAEAMACMIDAVRCIEVDGDPWEGSDDIPF